MKNKLNSVIRHEYFTIIRQPGFILSMVGIPILILAISAISYFADQNSAASIEEATSEIENIVVLDKSGIISETVVESSGLTFKTDDKADVIESVRRQEVDGAIIYPEDLAETRQYELYIDGVDSFIASSALNDIGEQLIRASVISTFDDESLGELLSLGAQSSITTFADGIETAGFGQYVVPGLIMMAFFIILFFSIGYMLLSVSEEKENRSMEMVLTYLHPKTLISGKLFSIGLIGLTQLLFFTIVGIVAYQFINRYELMTLPFDLDLSTVVFDPASIIAGLIVLVAGFLLFAAFMSGIASVMPSVKEANSLSGVFYLLAFAPFWATSVVMAAPESFIVRFLTFFPLTSPTTLLFRNTVGNISGLELVLAISVLIVSTVLSFLLAAKLFRMGALEFNDRVKIRSLFR